MDRRTLLTTFSAGLLATATPRLVRSQLADDTQTCLLAWQNQEGQHFVGLYELDNDELSSQKLARKLIENRKFETSAVDPENGFLTPPTVVHQGRCIRSQKLSGRPHGLSLCQQRHTVLVTARRPGDWLARWNWLTGEFEQIWSETESTVNGHALLVPGPNDWGSNDLSSNGLDLNGMGSTVWTTETHRITGRGCLVIRDPNTLKELTRIDSGGLDPHQMVLWSRPAVGKTQADKPYVLVANGGQKTNLLMGRVTENSPLESNLTLVDPRAGTLIEQWTSNNPWLSLRHLSVLPDQTRVGVAMQCKHPDASIRKNAPSFASLSSQGLEIPDAPWQTLLQGYGGDVTSTDQGFCITSPVANKALLLSPTSQLLAQLSLEQACATLPVEQGFGLATNTPAETFDNHGLKL